VSLLWREGEGEREREAEGGRRRKKETEGGRQRGGRGGDHTGLEGIEGPNRNVGQDDMYDGRSFQVQQAVVLL
jgi:hypothetical protein